MSERERLVELLKQNCHCKDEDCSNCSSNGICFTHREADYLLENGVIVPPVKIGQTVYGISRGAIIPIGVDRIQYSKRGIDILGRNEQYYGYGTIMLDRKNKIGLEWYKTKKEAEAALKKMEGTNE